MHQQKSRDEKKKKKMRQFETRVLSTKHYFAN